MICERCEIDLEIIEVIKTDYTTNRPFDRVIAQCPKCRTVINTKYDPMDWWTKKQEIMMKRLMSVRG